MIPYHSPVMSLERLSVVHARNSTREGVVARVPSLSQHAGGSRGEGSLAHDAAQVGADDSSRPAGFAFETCLRRLWISNSSANPADRPTQPGFGTERYAGVEAYEFLLRVACGLESEIVGESDVFGQLKESWHVFRTGRTAGAQALESLMQRLFEDVKEIRSRHLATLGATTYGSLVRTLLGSDIESPTLLVGAGRMARVILPYLAGRPLLIANRTPARASQLRDELAASLRASSQVRVLPADPAAELAAWRSASNVIVCIPANPERDALRVQAWSGPGSRRGRLLHLGLLTSAGSVWSSIPSIATLGDLFGLQAAHQDRRQLRFERARRACRERARLRDLGGPLSVAHGWEDLSLFANIA